MVTKVTQAEIEGCRGEEDKKASLGAQREAGGDFASAIGRRTPAGAVLTASGWRSQLARVEVE